MPKKILIPPYDPKLKNPPYPEHVTEDLRERMRKGPVTLSTDELERIIAMLEILSNRCGAIYQVLGRMADYANMTQDPEMSRVMTLMAYPLERGEVLPFNPMREEEMRRAYLTQQKWAKKQKPIFDRIQKEIEAERKGRRKPRGVTKRKARS